MSVFFVIKHWLLDSVQEGGDLDNQPDALTCLNNTVLINSPTQNHMDTSQQSQLNLEKANLKETISSPRRF